MNFKLILKEVIFALINSATIIFTGYLTYLYAIKKLSKESIENIEHAKYEAILKTHQSIYKLLKRRQHIGVISA